MRSARASGWSASGGRVAMATAVLLMAGAGRAGAGEEGLGVSGREAGRELFTRSWVPDDPRSRAGDGLGPVFNAQACVDCHDRGGVGGAGRSARDIEIASATGGAAGQGASFFYSFGMAFGAGRFEYRIGSGTPEATARGDRGGPTAADRAALEAVHPGFGEASSVVLHRFGVDPAYADWRAGVPGAHGAIGVRLSRRNPTPLFGVGLIDAIPDAAIEGAARRSPRAVRGRVARADDGGVGRFGWKGQVATLERFVLSAAAGELGLEVPGHSQAADPRRPGLGAPGLDLGREDCDALVAFVRSLPRPVVAVEGGDAELAEAGATTFRAIGCASCHVPDLGGVEGLYSDLLLHDVGPRLVDTGSYIAFGARPAADPAARDGDATASDREWRTPPLWGLRDSGPYLHDGRAATISEAILQHDGQAAPAARRFAQLSGRRLGQLEAFLLSLAAPPEEGARHGPAR